MLPSLKFVLRGVAKSELIPHLTHFRIHKGRVTAFNGTLALSAPLPLSFDTAPLALPFIKALSACEDTISITQESAGRLIVRSGSFTATVPCVELKTVPTVRPEGISMLPVDLVAAFKALSPFICTDPARPALNGILLTGESAYTTNNISVVQCWLGTPFPFEANVPAAFVDEVVRIKEEPKTVQMTATSITLHYADGRWIRSQLNSLEWPHVAGVLNKAWAGATLAPIAEPFKAACEKLQKFGAHHTVFCGHTITTEDETASVEVSAPEKGRFYTSYLADVLNVAEQADFSRWPEPVAFASKTLRGVLVGVRG